MKYKCVLYECLSPIDNLMVLFITFVMIHCEKVTSMILSSIINDVVNILLTSLALARLNLCEYSRARRKVF